MRVLKLVVLVVALAGCLGLSTSMKTSLETTTQALRRRGGHHGITEQSSIMAMRKAMNIQLSRLAMAVVESGRRKSPCVCAGMCSVDDSSETECQQCQLFMGYFNHDVERILGLKENSGVYLATVKALAAVDVDDMDQVASAAAQVSCLKIQAEVEGWLNPSPLREKIRAISPMDNKHAQMLGDIALECQNEEWLQRLACIGGVQHLQISKALFPLIEPSRDQGAQLSAFTDRVLAGLVPGGFSPTELVQAADGLGAPNFVPARTTFNSALCAFAGVNIEDCGLAHPAFLKIAGHRKSPLLAPMYEDVYRLLTEAAFNSNPLPTIGRTRYGGVMRRPTPFMWPYRVLEEDGLYDTAVEGAGSLGAYFAGDENTMRCGAAAGEYMADRFMRDGYGRQATMQFFNDVRHTDIVEGGAGPSDDVTWAIGDE